MISRTAFRLSGIRPQCYPRVLYARHRSLPSESFNHTPQSGRFGCASAGAYLFPGNAVPKHLGQSSRFVVFHKPPLQNSSEFKWRVLDYLSLLPFGYLPVIVNPIWGEYNHTSNNAFAFLPIFPTTMRTGCLSPATISTTGRSSHDGGTLHALSSYLPPDLETQR